MGSTASQKRLFLEANIENQTEEFNAIIASSTSFEKAYSELDYDYMMSQEYDKTLADKMVLDNWQQPMKKSSYSLTGKTKNEFLADYLGGGQKGFEGKKLTPFMQGRHKFKGTPISPQYLAKASATDLSENELDRLSSVQKPKTKLSKELVKVFTPDDNSPTIKITETWLNNTNLGQKDASGKFIAKGGNSETIVNIILANGMKGGVHKDWFVNLNKTVDPDIILAISNAFFDKHHEGLLTKKAKTGYESTMKERRVTSDYKKTTVNSTAFVNFFEKHQLFKPYKKSTES